MQICTIDIMTTLIMEILSNKQETIKAAKLILYLLLLSPTSQLFGQEIDNRYFEIIYVEDMTRHGGINLICDGFFDWFQKYELVDVYQRGVYKESDSTLELIPIVELDSINIVSVSQIKMADPGKVKILFYDIFNKPMRVWVSADCVDWNGPTGVYTASDSVSSIYIRSSDFESDYLKDVLLRQQPYRWDTPIKLSLENHRGQEIKVIISEEVDYNLYNKRQWWSGLTAPISLTKKRNGIFLSTDNKIMLRGISIDEYHDRY